MIALKGDRLELYFPEVHEKAHCTIEFQRTLRIPDDDREYPLPHVLGAFPLKHLDDYASRLPDNWRCRGGVIVPMHQSEALRIKLDSSYYFAIKVATGKICAVSGYSWTNHLNHNPQDYVVTPTQSRLDGYCVENGNVRQFVAMPLGDGYTVEEQLTGFAVHGGIQIIAFPMKAFRYDEMLSIQCEKQFLQSFPSDEFEGRSRLLGLGIAKGGRLKQHFYKDKYGINAWVQYHGSRCFVSLVNSSQWYAITGDVPPFKPPKFRSFENNDIPWFPYYQDDARIVKGSRFLTKIMSISSYHKYKRGKNKADDQSIDISNAVSHNGNVNDHTG